jgi:hypothetical protein
MKNKRVKTCSAIKGGGKAYMRKLTYLAIFEPTELVIVYAFLTCRVV